MHTVAHSQCFNIFTESESPLTASVAVFTFPYTQSTLLSVGYDLMFEVVEHGT